MKTMARMLLIFVAAFVAPMVFLQGCSQTSGTTAAAAQKCEMCEKGVPHKHYTCPMCGGNKAVANGAQPGKCAGCGMDMVEKKK